MPTQSHRSKRTQTMKIPPAKRFQRHRISEIILRTHYFFVSFAFIMNCLFVDSPITLLISTPYLYLTGNMAPAAAAPASSTSECSPPAMRTLVFQPSASASCISARLANVAPISRSCRKLIVPNRSATTNANGTSAATYKRRSRVQCKQQAKIVTYADCNAALAGRAPSFGKSLREERHLNKNAGKWKRNSGRHRAT